MAKNHGSYDPVNKGLIRICCMTLNMSDRLRLLACPPEVVPLVRETIQKNWEAGIQVERGYNGSHEFKLKGSPWHAIGETSVSSRRLICGILTTMANLGWNLIQSTDVSKREGDKDSLFFEKGGADPDARLFVVSFNQSNRIRIIDAPDLMPCIVDACNQFWTKGVEEETEFNGCMELKLKGNPWYPIAEDAVKSKLVLCKVLANFRSLGYKLYASVDLSYGTEGTDLETWVLRRIWHDLEFVPTACQSCGDYAHKPEHLELDNEEEENMPFTDSD